ncbi:MAG: TonB family protein [Saprospiraceae bacterium]|nr:TonB family protein [Saprospiraceae bacterium]
MKKERRKDSFINKPIYPGGMKAMRKFVKERMIYPQEALESKIEGSVLVKYEVNYKGKVTKTEIASGLGYGCDEEAARLVRMFIFKVGKSPRKLRVKFHKSIRINFKLPKVKEKPKTSNVQVNYTITKSKAASPPSSSSSYSYTINI